MEYSCAISSPIGKLGIAIEGDYLTKIQFLSKDTALFTSNSSLVKQVISELQQYFVDPRFCFTIPYQVTGKQLQKQIWDKLLQIPVGTTITYGELAKSIGTSPRIIGNACRANPIPIIIPCHRVVAASGIGGFCGKSQGETIDVKRWLLRHEVSDLNI